VTVKQLYYYTKSSAFKSQGTADCCMFGEHKKRKIVLQIPDILPFFINVHY